jgi:hypothetical protein
MAASFSLAARTSSTAAAKAASSTSIGTYSIHQLVPEFFTGYRTDPGSGIKMATPEKCLLDVLYLAAARSRLFAHLPELELPRNFSVRRCRQWIARIPAAYRRQMVQSRLDTILGQREERLTLTKRRPHIRANLQEPGVLRPRDLVLPRAVREPGAVLLFLMGALLGDAEASRLAQRGGSSRRAGSSAPAKPRRPRS